MKLLPLKQLLSPLIPLVVIMMIAETLSRKGIVPAFLMPAPSQVFQSVLDDPDSFKKAFFETGMASMLGLLLSTMVGLCSALILSYSKTIREMFYPYALFFQTVPIIAIAPILVIWLGYGMPTVIASSFIVSVFPVIANSVMGLLSTDPQLLGLFKMMDASPTQVLFKLRLPYAIPQILAGFQIAGGLAVIGAIVGEFISGSGLGGLVDSARNQQRVDRVFAAVLLAALLGIIFFTFVSLLRRSLMKKFIVIFLFALGLSSNFVQAAELALNWKPEPEFGGFYEAMLNQSYEKAGLPQFQILPGGAGQPVPQMVAAKKAVFGVAAGDEVILARSQGAKIVALYAVYQEDPQGFMVHPEKKVSSLKELFQSEGTIALQKGLSYTMWLEKQFAPIKAHLVPYTGGITSFIKDKTYSQQCFVFAEPIAAHRQGLSPKTFLISESGFNPYLTVVIAHEDTLRDHPEMVKAFLKATRQGWTSYLANPKKTNEAMQKMNPSMDLATFAEATKLQESFISTAETGKKGLGTMNVDRWKKLYDQMVILKLVKPGMDVTQVYKNE